MAVMTQERMRCRALILHRPCTQCVGGNVCHSPYKGLFLEGGCDEKLCACPISWLKTFVLEVVSYDEADYTSYSHEIQFNLLSGARSNWSYSVECACYF